MEGNFAPSLSGAAGARDDCDAGGSGCVSVCDRVTLRCEAGTAAVDAEDDAEAAEELPPVARGAVDAAEADAAEEADPNV